MARKQNGSTWSRSPGTSLWLGIVLTTGLALVSIASAISCDPDPECGNGKVEGDEECDGLDLGGNTCETIGYYGGTLSCGEKCLFDVSGCEADPCEAFDLYGDGELCDPCPELSPEGAPDPDCEALCDLQDGQCSSYHSRVAEGWSCALAGLGPDPDCGVCGDSVASPAEDCDGTDLKGLTCESFGGDWGELSCDESCALDLSGCVYYP